jgi:hypothetical protein
MKIRTCRRPHFVRTPTWEIPSSNSVDDKSMNIIFACGSDTLTDLSLRNVWTRYSFVYFSVSGTLLQRVFIIYRVL